MGTVRYNVINGRVLSLVSAKIFATYSELIPLNTAYRNLPIPSPLQATSYWPQNRPKMAKILYLVAVLKATTRRCSQFRERDTILAETKA